MSKCEEKLSKSAEKLVYSLFPDVSDGKLTLEDLQEKVIDKGDNIPLDELRLLYLENQFPIRLEQGEEPSEEDNKKYYVVQIPGRYILFPSTNNKPRKIKDSKGKEFPIVVPADKDPSNKEKRLYYVIEGDNDEYLLYSRKIMKDDKGRKYPIILDKDELPSDKDYDRYYVGQKPPKYLLYPRVDLREYQKEPSNLGLEMLTESEVIMNVTKQGLGKTYMTIYKAQNLGADYKVVVICPSGPPEDMWGRYLAAYGIDTYDIRSYRSIGGTWGKQYHATTLLNRNERITDGGLRKVDFTTSEELQAIIEDQERPLLLICDEIHHAKNSGSKSTQAIRAIVSAMIRFGGIKDDNGEIIPGTGNLSRAIYLSGTPVDNISSQCVNYLHLMGVINSPQLYISRDGVVEMTGARQLLEYCQSLDKPLTDRIVRELFTNSRTGYYDQRWHLKKTQIRRLPAVLFEKVIRVKLFIAAVKEGNTNAISKDDKGKDEEVIEIEDDEEVLVPDSRSKETEFQEDIANFYLDVDTSEARDALIANTKDLETAAEYDFETQEACITASKSMSLLTPLIRERQVLKAAILTDYLKKRLDTIPNIKVIISCDYKDPLKVLKEQFADYDPIIYDGESKGKMKKEGCTNAIYKFNTDPKKRVWIGNTRSMSESISLHDTIGNSPRELWILPGLSAMSIDQIRFRHTRDGMKSQSKTRLVFVDGQETEMYIFNSLANKSSDMKTMLTDKAKKTRQTINELPSEYQKDL